MAQDGTIKINTELDDSQAQKAMSKFSSIASTGLKVTAAAVAAVATALVGAGAYAIKTGIEFETAFAGVKKTVDATDAELAEMRQGIIDMSKRMPSSAAAIAEVAEAAGQLGIKNEHLISFTEVMTNLGVATNMSATEAATSLARLANITGMPQESFDRLGSTVVALGNNLATTESEIVDMGLRLAGAGKQVGMTEAQIMGMSGALSSVGIAADAGGSAMSTVMSKMQLAAEKGGESLENFASVAGMSANEFKQAFEEDAAGAIVSFVNGLGNMDAEGQSAIKTLDDMGITEIRQRDALLRLAGAGDILADSIKLGTEAWDENTALANEAAQKYETLESRIQILKNNVDAVAISFYDDMRPALVDTVNEGINYVDQLAAAFDSGGLQGVVKAAGDIFADLAVNVAKKAPDMVSAAVEFIQAFGSGIAKNKGKIYDSAVDIASTLGKGLANLLPKSVSEPVTKAVDSLAKSGGIKDAVKTVSNMFKTFGDVAGKVAKVTLPVVTKAVDLLGSNLDILVPTVAAGAAAFKGYTIVQNVSKWFKTASAASVAYAAAMTASTTATSASSAASILLASTMSATELIVGVLTGKVTLATAAQVAWNAVLNANPIGLVVTAVAALVGGLAVYKSITSEAAEATYGLSEKEEELLEKCNETTAALKEQHDAHAESVAAIDREYDSYGRLITELKSITDENGKVKEGYKERAAVITNQLADALGVEISMTDDVIDNYQEVISTIDQVIVKKKAEALLSSMQDDVAKAYENSKAAMDAYKDSAAVVAEHQTTLNRLNQEHAEAIKQVGTEMDPYGYKALEIAEAIEAEEKALAEATTEMDANRVAMSDLKTETENYEALVNAVASGDIPAIEAAMNTLVTSFKSYTAETLATSDTARQEMLNQAQDYLEYLKMIQDGSVEVADSVYQDFATAAVESIAEFKKLPGGVAAGIEEIGPEASAAMVSALAQADIDGKLDTEAKQDLESFINGFSGLDAKTQEVWSQAWYGALEGLEGFESLADPATEGVDAFLESLRAALQVHSPSVAVQEIFSNVWPGAEAGLGEGQDGVLSKGEGFLSTFLGLFTNAQLGETAKSAGQSIMDFFGLGVSEKTENSKSAGQTNAQAASDGAGSVDPTDKGGIFGVLFGSGILGKIKDSKTSGSTLAGNAKTGAGSINPNSTGLSFGGKFNSGVGNKTGEAKTKGSTLANGAKTGAGSINPNSTGLSFGGKFNSGVGNKKGEARTKGTLLASNANSGAKSVKGTSAGEGFGSGFVSGIASWIGRAASKAASLASSALAAAKNVLNINSPSKETIKLGRSFDEGFEVGIDKDADKVEKSAENLSNTALDAIDADALQEKLQALDIASEMDKVYAAVDSQHRILSDNVTQELVVRVEQDAKTNNTVKLSDGDLSTLMNFVNMIANRPIIAQSFFDKRDATRALANPIKQQQEKNTKIQSRLNGVK